MSTEMIRLVHPKTKGFQETTRAAFEVRGGHRSKGWVLMDSPDTLKDFDEERLRDIAAYVDVDLTGVEGGTAEIAELLVKAPVGGLLIDPDVPSVLNPDPEATKREAAEAEKSAKSKAPKETA